MATTTPNFGWPVPTSTDLVKDGATAMEALGDAIDTSMVDLKGGTTGQVLAKASNTDMDFSWVAQDDSNAIQNSIVDAKGDLIAATAADTPARLAVGTNGQVLTADSTAATGLAWATASAGSASVAGKNGVLNSAFNVWQRGTSVAGAGGGTYTADRWFLYAGGQITVSRQATGDTTNLPFIQYCARVQRANASADTTNFSFGQSFETINSIPFAGKTISYSFYARKGANYSSASNTLGVLLTSGTGTDQNKQSAGYTGNVDIINTNVTLTNTWQRFTFNGLSVASTATELAPFFSFTPTGTAGAADYYEVTGVQLEIAGSASAYSPNTSTFQAELAACQRYFQVITAGPSTGINSSTQIAFNPTFSPMRTSSITFALTGALGITDVYTADFNQSSANITTNSNNGVSGAILSFGNFTGLTAYRGYSLKSTNQITASAEL